MSFQGMSISGGYYATYWVMILNGELPNDLQWTGKIVQDICYNNTREYFGFYEVDIDNKKGDDQ